MPDHARMPYHPGPDDGLPLPYARCAALCERAGPAHTSRVGGLLRPSLELRPDVPEDAPGRTPAGRTGGAAALPPGIDRPAGDGHPMEPGRAGRVRRRGYGVRTRERVFR